MSAQGREFKELAFTLAERLVNKSHDEKAVEVFNELLKRHPEHQAARYQLLRAYGRLGKTKERQEQF
jgi:DNA-binding SARP family transcriptional activator